MEALLLFKNTFVLTSSCLAFAIQETLCHMHGSYPIFQVSLRCGVFSAARLWDVAAR